MTALLRGVKVGSLAQYRAMRVRPSHSFIKEFCREFGFNESWFISGSGEPYKGARKDYPAVCGPETSATATPSPDIPPDEFVFIKKMRGKISAGVGLEPDNVADMALAFRRDWIVKKGRPDRMSLIKVDGDSMEPTLMAGDLVLVNHSRTVVTPQGGIYAISLDGEIMIKRIQIIFPQNRLRIISDNPRYEPIEADPDQVRVNGRVIWYGREIER